VKNRFQSLPFKCNLQRYTTAEDADMMLDYQNPPYLEADMPPGWGLHRLNPVQLTQ
jgi:hypothetical protein